MRLDRLVLGLALTFAAAAAPVIENGKVTNAASYADPSLPSGSLARGGMIVIKGSGLGPATLQIISSFPLTTQLAGTTVNATVNGNTVPLYLVYTSDKQVAAILPSNVPTGQGTISVTYNGQSSPAAQIRVVKSAFGIFTLNEAGSGPGVFQNANSGTDQPVNTLTVPARPGQLAIIWGTGLGPVSATDEGSKAVPGDIADVNVQVYVGGKPATVTYKGRSGCCAGIDQIVFTVPAGVEGCYAPVVVVVDGVASNFTTMSIAGQGSACTNTSGVTGGDIEKAQRTGSLSIGSLSLSRSVISSNVLGQTFEIKNDSGAGIFTRFNFEQLIRSQGSVGSDFALLTFGSCTAYAYSGGGDRTPVPVDVVKPTELDAGPVINVNGPKGAKQLTKQNGIYAASFSSSLPIPGSTPNDYLEPGSYTIDNGSGGSGSNAVGAFRVTLNVPQLLNWTNASAVSTVVRSSGQEITWTGGDTNGFVYIFGVSSNGSGGAGFYCMERANVGRFSIPSYVLQTLPATTGQDIGLLSVNGVSALANFTASGLDQGSVQVVGGSSKTVSFR